MEQIFFPNGNGYVQCGYCGSAFAFDYNNQALYNVNNNRNMGTANIGSSSNVVINNYYSAPNNVQNNQMQSPNGYQNNQMSGGVQNNQGQGAMVGVSPLSRGLVSLLCFFLGFFGVHYFYAGRPVMGVLYIFTGGLFGIGWFVDLIRTLSGVFPDSNNLPITNW